MVEIAPRIYYADLGGEWTSDKYAIVCQICHSGCVFGSLANKDEFPAHRGCIEGLKERTKKDMSEQDEHGSR